MLKVQFINDEQWGINASFFRPFLRRLEKAISTYDGILNVVFVNDEYIQALNKAYRQKDKPTDVLSFNYIDAEGGSDLVGEVYISIPTTKHNAKTNSDTFENELSKLFVHGILHVHGYDHVLDKDYVQMHAKECEILDRDLPLYLDQNEH